MISSREKSIEEDLATGILGTIGMDSYRVEKKALLKIALADSDAEIEPVPVEGGGHKGEPKLDRLSQILTTFNDNFGILFTDGDRVAKRIRDDIAPKVDANAAYQNTREKTPHTARMAHNQALGKAMQILFSGQRCEIEIRLWLPAARTRWRHDMAEVQVAAKVGNSANVSLIDSTNGSIKRIGSQSGCAVCGPRCA